MVTEKKLSELNIQLPTPLPPIANYVSVQRTGDLIFTSGAGPFWNGEIKFVGKLGVDLTVEQGYDAAVIDREADVLQNLLFLQSAGYMTKFKHAISPFRTKG